VAPYTCFSQAKYDGAVTKASATTDASSSRAVVVSVPSSRIFLIRGNSCHHHLVLIFTGFLITDFIEAGDEDQSGVKSELATARKQKEIKRNGDAEIFKNQGEIDRTLGELYSRERLRAYTARVRQSVVFA
jgi:hypothetical protein